MTMITPSYLGETIEYSSLHACRSTLEDPTDWISFVGETDGSGWYRNFEKPFWEDPSEYLRRSPIMYAAT